MTHTLHSLGNAISHSDIPANDIINYLEIISLLRKKYGKKIYQQYMIDIIQKVEPWIASLIRLLVIHNATENNDIKQLCRTIKYHNKKYISQFEVFIPKDKYLDPIQKKLQKKFPQSTIYKQTNIDMGVEIRWEWRYYKRNLDQDIEKLLG